MERHSNNRQKQLKCCISCSPCQLQVLTSSHGPARQVASSKYGNTPSQWVALGAEPCWVAIRDTNLERAKLCSLPPSEREGALGSQGERGRERTAWRKGESERDKERERERGEGGAGGKASMHTSAHFNQRGSSWAHAVPSLSSHQTRLLSIRRAGFNLDTE